MEELIRVTQLPIIEERLRDVKAAWEQAAADNMALVCTSETIGSVKAARADMTKQFERLEALRKTAKAQYMERWTAFEATYKECIAEPYKRADAALKAKIDETESAIKTECEQRCREYFAELCAVHGVDFVKYESMHLKIDMTAAKQKTPRKLFDQMSEWVSAVACGMDKIDQESDPDDRDEIMAEYKRCLDVGEAILRVQDRHKRVAQERGEAAKREERRTVEAATVAKVEAALPLTAPQEVEAEPLLTVSFKATATREKLIALREFMKSEGIKYE